MAADFEVPAPRLLTQQELAEKTPFSRNRIQQIGTAKATPSVAALIDIVGALDIPVGKLFELRT